MHPVPGDGTEDVLVEVAGPHEGSVLTGTADGAVLRVSHDGRRTTCLGRTGGRPLGLEWLGDGRVLVCDAHRGLLALDPATSRVEVLVDAVDGVPLRFCNNAAVAADGAVWFSDSSRVHGLDEWEKDFARLTRTGRLLRRAPDGEVTVHLDGLAFANGVVLGPGDAWVAVAETAARTVVRLELTGPRAGERSLLAGDLPGYPDNLAPAADGGLWVALASPRDPVVEVVQRGPRVLRRALSSLPEAVRPSPRRVVQALELGPDGTVRRSVDVRDPAALARFHMVTGVREHDGRLWLGSLRAGAVAVLDVTRPT
ncbi:SMP-30/gluconolactonase/LRE family protein [Nocardioides zeae]|uniref:SMP-30/gluconolactonase/LRE family protein n=1 Tax=Nocardioides imazamoxiresistens TaxID=3231893 RepID=A0ABU3PTC5_9ACTN|nr:SMP-30/gluconolactonase/LRE family protein [Nocardioides zeae]MDT9592495.1 SMP-30/gluconolactonase/LRE family protein [Nocardioides zeae]